MPSFIYRVVLVSKESKTQRLRQVLTELVTTSIQEVGIEIKSLQEMTARPSWKIATEIQVIRVTVFDFELIPGNEIFLDDEEPVTPPARPAPLPE